MFHLSQLWGSEVELSNISNEQYLSSYDVRFEDILF